MDDNLIKILAIDDNQDNLITINAIIKDAFPEAKVFTAINGLKGIEMATSKDPDVILLDVIMPDMDGYEVCQKLKADPIVSVIPVVFVTAIKGDREGRIHALEVGAEAFLAKPIDESELIAQVKAMVKIKRANIMKRDENLKLSLLVDQRTSQLQVSNTATLNLFEDLRQEIEIKTEIEAALRESEARLTRAELASKSGNWELNIRSKTMTSSVGASKLYGLEGLEFNYDLVKDIPLPEYRETLNTALKNLIEKDEPYDLEFQIKQCGTDKIIDIHSIAFFDKEKNVVFGVIQDITNEKQAKEALSESELKFRTFVDFTYDWEYWEGLDDQIIYTTPSCYRISGYTAQEFIHDNTLLKHIVHPDDKEVFFNHFTKLHTKEFQLDTEEFIFRIINKNSNVVYIEHLCQPVYDINGNYNGRRISNRDITEKKIAMDALHDSEMKFRDMADLLPQVIFEADLFGNLTYVNKQAYKICGYDLDDNMIGINTIDLYIPEDRIRAIENVNLSASGQPHGSNVYTMMRKDGTTFPVLVYSTPIMKQNKPIGLRGLIVDITEQKQSEIKLQYITRLYALLSHVNQAIIKIKNVDELLQTICELAIEYGQFRMCWIGTYDEKRNLILPRATAGHVDGYLDDLIIIPGDDKYGNGPTGRSFYEGKQNFSNDISSDPLMIEYKDEALKRGYFSSFSSPIFRKQKKTGTITLYTSEINFFNEEEQHLLSEISENISYAIDAIDSELERLYAEELLIESEEKYRNLMDNSPEGITIYVDGKIAYINKEAMRLMKANDKSELMGKTIVDFIHPDNQTLVLERMKLVAMAPLNAILPSVEEKYIRLDGTEVDVEVKVMPILFEGKPAFQLSGHDITVRKAAEYALEKSRIELKAIYDNAPVMMCVVGEDASIQFANQAFAFLTDSIKSDMIGGQVGNVISCINAKKDEQGCGFGILCKKCALRNAITNTLDTGIGYSNIEHQSLLMQNGQVNEVSLLASTALIQNGVQKSLLLCLIDITERKNIEKSLQKSETFLRTFIENTPFEIWARDIDSVGILENKKLTDHYGSIIGYTPTNDPRFNSETLRLLEKNNDRAFAGEIVTDEYEFDVFGKQRVYQQIAFPIKNNDKTIGIAGFNIDITDKKLAEDALRESKDQLKKFAAHLQNVREEERIMLAREIHDELGQILVAVKIDMGLLRKNVVNNSVKVYSDKVLVKFDDLSKLIDTTIQTARKIMTDLRPEVLDMLGFVDAVKQHLNNFHERYNVACIFESTIDEVNLGSQQAVALFRIIQEALNNIAKHAKASEVKITLTNIEDKLLLQVIDNGVGFDLNKSKRTDSYGLIGMKERVYLLEGEINITSEINKGTHLEVILPYEINKK
jgi:PAS domain S-box-containing protein